MQLSNLNYLGLSKNQIVGSIPTSIGNLTKLTVLDLSFNQLTGILPPSLGNLRELILCYFGGNSNLTGDIPPSLGNLTKVEDLFLNECDFTGKIPPELGNMTNLKKLLLSGNRLSDTLPTNLGNLQNLKTMGLDDNQLTGKIPVSFRNLRKLVCLIFNNNQIDSVPNLTNLAQLDTGCLASYINHLTFDDIVPNQRPNAPRFSHSYSQQAEFFKDTTIQGVLNTPLSIDLKIDATMAENVWRWNKNGTFWRTETGINKLIFNNLQSTDAGIYDVQVTNPKAPNLTLQSRKITINLCTNTVNTTTQTPVICNGQTYRLPNGQIVNTATNYRDTLRYQSGCDSLIRIVNVTTSNNPTTTNLNLSICRGQSYTLPNGQIVTPSVTTTYRDTLKSQVGCDSLIRVVTVTPTNSAATTNLNPNICRGQSYALPNGQIVTPSVTTTYRDTLKSQAGCDSLIRIVTVTPTNSSITTNLNSNICKGQSYTLPNGQIITPSVTTTYRDTLKSRAGCDSLIRITNLSVSNTLIEAFDDKIELNTGDSAIINLILNDKLSGQNGRITILKTPSEGVTQRVNDSQIRYTAPQILRGGKEQTLTYKVCLTDCPDNCDSATLRITIDENNIATGRIKNGVAPQLSGEEYFEIDSIQAFTQAQLFIYNSWNELVFKSAVPYDNRWKGTGQNDAPLPSGVYYYVLRHIAPNRKHLEGKILLLHD
jgi:Leucine-rich repeat (LRR) protein